MINHQPRKQSFTKFLKLPTARTSKFYTKTLFEQMNRFFGQVQPVFIVSAFELENWANLNSSKHTRFQPKFLIASDALLYCSEVKSTTFLTGSLLRTSLAVSFTRSAPLSASSPMVVRTLFACSLIVSVSSANALVVARRRRREEGKRKSINYYHTRPPELTLIEKDEEDGGQKSQLERDAC